MSLFWIPELVTERGSILKMGANALNPRCRPSRSRGESTFATSGTAPEKPEERGVNMLNYYFAYTMMRGAPALRFDPLALRRNDVACIANVAVDFRGILCCVVSLLALLASPARVRAQNICEAGNQTLSSHPPSGISVPEIIRRFAANETAFKKARERYSYELDISVQTLTPAGQVDGAFRQVSEFAPGKNGVPAETVTYAPESTLRRISLGEDDFDAIHSPVRLTTEELPSFSVEYLGRQRVDALDTYVFNATPTAAKNDKHEKNLFVGRVWVDAQDFVIVKTCGKPRPDVVRPPKKGLSDLSPMFVTYREQIDGKFWFPTYSKADDYLDFPRGDVHVREVIRYSNYKSAAAQ